MPQHRAGGRRLAGALLGGLGVAVPLVSGVALTWFDAAVHPALMLLLLFVAGFLSGMLVRGGAAATLASVAFVLGAGASAWSQGILKGPVLLVILVLCAPLAAGAVGGVDLGVWLEERMRGAGVMRA